MNQITVQTKKFLCFTCGQEITFGNKWVKNKFGKIVKERLNIDGTAHICNQEQKEKYQSSDEGKKQKSQSSSDKRRKWWFGYGQYRYSHGYKKEYNAYNGRQYEDQWKQNKERRDEYKQKYASDLTVESALNILGLDVETIKLNMKEFISTVKTAYRKLALKFHPDKSRTNDTARQFQQVTEAYELLETRFKYGN